MGLKASSGSPQLYLSSVSASPRLWIEIDDLVRYFDGSSTPTGIGRVQLELLPRLIERYPNRISLCRIGRSANDVQMVSPKHLAALVGGLDVQHAGRPAKPLQNPLTRALLRRLRAALDAMLHAPHARTSFANLVKRGDVLVSLGASWTHHRYGQSVRALRQRYGMRFALLIHDILPISHPQYVHQAHIPNFRRWLDDMSLGWDVVLTPSRASADFLTDFLISEGATPPPTFPIPFGFGLSPMAETFVSPLETDPYVLFVSTIEIRKNHILALRVWQQLVARHGPERIPKLIFAGKMGWGVDELRRALAACDNLNGKVRIVSSLSDAEIARAYKDCLFTIFPSFCEGWGLPVSESIKLGKFCVASNATSIPEIAGDAIDYFDPHDEQDAFSTIERVILQPDYLKRREDFLRQEMRIPTWDDTAAAIVSILTGELTGNVRPHPPHLALT